MSAHRIAVIVGSTRPKRICREIAEWVLTTAQLNSALTYEILDLKDVALPILDEPEMAATGHYAHEHTKSWSDTVESYDGFVFVMPQYNWGYTAVVKNALDYLHAEWRGKAAGIVSYGTRGGVRAIAQLDSVLEGIGMRRTATHPALNTRAEFLDTNGRFIDIADAFAEFAATVRAMNTELTELIEHPAIAPE